MVFGGAAYGFAYPGGVAADDVSGWWQLAWAVRAAKADPTRIAAIRKEVLAGDGGAARLRRFERVAGRLTAALSSKCEHLYLPVAGAPPPPLADVGSHFGLWLLCQQVVLAGPEAVCTVLATPMAARSFLAAAHEPGSASTTLAGGRAVGHHAGKLPGALSLLRLFFEPELRCA